jgi:transposase
MEPKNSDGSLQKSVKGMNIEIMNEWCDWAKRYIPKGSVLLMDRLSSHTNKQILDELKKNGITVLLIPLKAPFSYHL